MSEYQYLTRVMHPSPLEECLDQFEEIHSEYHSFCKTEPGIYDTLYDYLRDVFTENELIECLHTLSSCNCCEKHTGKHTESCENKYPRECQCLCRHNRRWIYRCLSKYVSDSQKHEDKNDYGYWV